MILAWTERQDHHGITVADNIVKTHLVFLPALNLYSTRHRNQNAGQEIHDPCLMNLESCGKNRKLNKIKNIVFIIFFYCSINDHI